MVANALFDEDDARKDQTWVSSGNCYHVIVVTMGSYIWPRLTFGRPPPELDAALLGSDLAVEAAKRGAKLEPDRPNGRCPLQSGLSANARTH